MSSEKDFINTLRYEGKIKGNRPFICTMAKSTTTFYNKSLKYIISYKDDMIYFQSLNYFNELPNQKHDYEINTNLIKAYSYALPNNNLISFSLITKKKGLINLLVYKNVKKRVYSQVSFNDFVDYLKGKGINDEDEKNRQAN